MKPGFELDKIIAERVMGASDFEIKYAEKYAGTPIYTIPEYSTDIAAAWEVVEKMKSNGFWFAFIHNPNQTLIRFYTPEQKESWDNHPAFKGNIPMDTIEKSAPHAICLAALKALEK